MFNQSLNRSLDVSNAAEANRFMAVVRWRHEQQLVVCRCRDQNALCGVIANVREVPAWCVCHERTIVRPAAHQSAPRVLVSERVGPLPHQTHGVLEILDT